VDPAQVLNTFRICLDGCAAATHVLHMVSSSVWVPLEAGGPTASAASMLSRRAGRIAFGTVLILGMAAEVYGAVRGPGAWAWVSRSFAHDEVHGWTHSGPLLALTWLVALVAYAVVRLAVRAAAPPPRDDALLRESLVVPAVGIALALPLTIHGLFFLLVGGDFGEWVAASVALVGLAHLVFALTFGMHAAQLARGEPRMTIRRVFWWSVCASLVPGALFLLPEILTAITGLFVLPVLHMFDALARRDRDALPVLPVARIA
jgi:hypothetical protein